MSVISKLGGENQGTTLEYYRSGQSHSFTKADKSKSKKICRCMMYSGCKRKFDVVAFERKYNKNSNNSVAKYFDKK